MSSHPHRVSGTRRQAGDGVRATGDSRDLGGTSRADAVRLPRPLPLKVGSVTAPGDMEAADDGDHLHVRGLRLGRPGGGERGEGEQDQGRDEAAPDPGAGKPGDGEVTLIGREGPPGRARAEGSGRSARSGSVRPARAGRSHGFGARRSALGARRSALGARRSALGARRSALGARRSALALGARRSALGARRSGRSALGALLYRRRNRRQARSRARGWLHNGFIRKRGIVGPRHSSSPSSSTVPCAPTSPNFRNAHRRRRHRPLARLPVAGTARHRTKHRRGRAGGRFEDGTELFVIDRGLQAVLSGKYFVLRAKRPADSEPRFEA